MSGCPFACEGCIEERLWSGEVGEEIEVTALWQRLKPLLKNVDGITFSGGEPLFQADALLCLLKYIKEETDVMLFTGESNQAFLEHYRKLHPYIDLCVTEKFVYKLHGNYLWRGSANQRFLSPTGKYDSKILELWYREESKGIELYFDINRAFIYGIPPPGQLKSLESLLSKKGICLNEV